MSRLGSKNKVQNPYTYKDMYKSYLATFNDDIDSPLYLSYSTYVKINNAYTNYILDRVLNKSLVFKLGHRLGSFQIVKKKVYPDSQKKYETVDWAVSKQIHKKVYHLNDHSGGFKYLFWWDKRGALITNITGYKFVPIRSVKRRLAYIIKNKIRDYFERKS
jgi:hypothetical protein